MARKMIQDFLKLIPAVKSAPQKYLWSSYDAEADVLYINFKKPSHATDSELTDDDVIIRYEGDAIIGMTILHASKRRIYNQSFLVFIRRLARRPRKLLSIFMEFI
jgi:uncharacterized protein YuzE